MKGGQIPMKIYKQLKSKNTKLTFRLSIVIGLLSFLISFIMNYRFEASFGDLALTSLIGFFIGFLITFFIVLLEIFVFQSKKYRTIPGIQYLLLKVFIYIAIGMVTDIIIGLIFFPEHVFEITNIITTILLIAFFSVIINITIFFTQFLGRDFFKSYLSAKYNKAKIKNSIFLFIDLSNSTSYAEKTSPEQFFLCLNDFIFLCEEVIRFYDGIIYKYVGDCIITVWDYNKKNLEKSFHCLHEIRNHFKENRKYFLDYYALDLEFTMGIHAGPVMAGEIGFEKREIGFLSDTVNTAQRIQGMNKILKTKILASADYIKLIKEEKPDLLKNIKIGLFKNVPIKGKTSRMNLYTFLPIS